MMHCMGALASSPGETMQTNASTVKADSTARAPNTLRDVWERLQTQSRLVLASTGGPNTVYDGRQRWSDGRDGARRTLGWQPVVKTDASEVQLQSAQAGQCFAGRRW
jgi:hypothetical protein